MLTARSSGVGKENPGDNNDALTARWIPVRRAFFHPAMNE
jgi:hypothetical protein